MADQIRVRFADRMDLDGCIALDHPDMPAEFIQRKVEQREIIVAEKAGQLVSYLRLEYLWSLVPYIALIWVVEDQRQQGVGRAMLRYLENVLCEQGHTALYSSSQANEPEPQAWHRHAGFEECGFIAGINGEGIGEIFFRKDLSCLTQIIAHKETSAPWERKTKSQL
ncbi:MAG: GNAT family N-acetyltransferase [Chloroflexi bacterium]|nr:GNAT family N-acetyltransferase [Chloroflexota bacterium]